VLKQTKTKFSKRGITVSRQLIAELKQRYEKALLESEYSGSDYNDYGLVFSFQDGGPVEPHRCEKWFKTWQHESGLDLPEIVFHGLRHASTTYKLEISEGDVKSVQQHTGHASGKMVFDKYGHFMDKSEQRLADRVERDFYGDTETEDDVLSSNPKIVEALKKSSEVKSDSVLTSLTSSGMEVEVLEKLLGEIKKKDPQLHLEVLRAVLATND